MVATKQTAAQWAKDHVGVSVEIFGRTWTIDSADDFGRLTLESTDGEARRLTSAATVMRAYVATNGRLS